MNKLTKKGNIYTWGNATYSTVKRNFRGFPQDFAGLRAALKSVGIGPDAREARIEKVTADHQKLRNELDAALASPALVQKLNQLLDLERELNLLSEEGS